jgi:hypothetical protein
VKPHVKYAIRRQSDGSYVILMKDLDNGRLTIHSNHDTYEDAHDELTDIHHKPSQAETIKFMNDLRNSIKNI